MSKSSSELAKPGPKLKSEGTRSVALQAESGEGKGKRLRRPDAGHFGADACLHRPVGACEACCEALLALSSLNLACHKPAFCFTFGNSALYRSIVRVRPSNLEGQEPILPSHFCAPGGQQHLPACTAARKQKHTLVQHSISSCVSCKFEMVW